MTSMLESKGPDYVVRWPLNLARRERLSVAYVGEALEALGVPRVEETVFHASEKNNTPVKEIGDLEPEQAMALIARVQEISKELAEARKNNCWCCGLKLNTDGTCRACGDVEI
jgi:hypothetical protein